MFEWLFQKKKNYEEKEWLILTDKNCSLGFREYDKKHYLKRISYIAFVDLATGEYQEKNGKVGKIVKRDDISELIAELDDYAIYHIKYRVEKKEDSEVYILTEIVAENQSHPELELLQYRCLNPKKIQDAEVGSFTYVRGDETYEADMDWLGDSIRVILEQETSECEPGTVEQSLEQFKIMYQDSAGWEERFRLYAADNITKEEVKVLAEKITPRHLYIAPDGNFSIYYQYGGEDSDLTITISGFVEKGIDRGELLDYSKDIDFTASVKKE